MDKYGPRVVVLFGGALCGIGWVINSYAASLNMFYLGQVVAGIGAGAVYGTCVGSALKWFPDKRGLAAGIIAAGFGAGSALTVRPDPVDDRRPRLPGRLLQLRHRPGPRRLRARLLLHLAQEGPGAGGRGQRQHHPDPAQLHPRRSRPPADLLAHVLHVRHRRRRRPDDPPPTSSPSPPISASTRCRSPSWASPWWPSPSRPPSIAYSTA